MPRSGVIAKVLPDFQHLIRTSVSQGTHGWKSREKATIIGNNRLHLGLLEHDLGNPNRIRIPCVPPGEIAGMTGVPSEQFCRYLICIHVIPCFPVVIQAKGQPDKETLSERKARGKDNCMSAGDD
jgi:hypothetical protein